jgi:hypothetical protein
MRDRLLRSALVPLLLAGCSSGDTRREAHLPEATPSLVIGGVEAMERSADTTTRHSWPATLAPERSSWSTRTSRSCARPRSTGVCAAEPFCRTSSGGRSAALPCAGSARTHRPCRGRDRVRRSKPHHGECTVSTYANIEGPIEARILDLHSG